MVTPFPLGRVVEHDPRSLNYPAPTGTTKTVLWAHYGAVLDQGHTSSCTGNAMAQALNSRPLHIRGQHLTETDAAALYSLATQLDEFPGTYPPNDNGSSGLGVAKAAQQLGKITAYTHAFGLDHALAALTNGPLLLGTNWHEAMFNPDAKGFVTVTGPVVGGHEYVLLGANTRDRYVTCLNSWSPSWGNKGRFRMSFDALNSLLTDNGDALQPTR